jgi:hypothetical protein
MSGWLKEPSNQMTVLAVSVQREVTGSPVRGGTWTPLTPRRLESGRRGPVRPVRRPRVRDQLAQGELEDDAVRRMSAAA